MRSTLDTNRLSDKVRSTAHVKRLVASSIAGLCLAPVSVALAHTNGWALTAPKAERIVMRDATVGLPGKERVALRDELQRLVSGYGALELAAIEEGDQRAASIFRRLRSQYSTALKKVRGGLTVTAADCTGTGSAERGNRFGHLACAVTSEALSVPSVELVYGDEQALPTVVEGEPRTFGPYHARMVVHATGRSSISYRLVGKVQ
jgi:hypothetical protein